MASFAGWSACMWLTKQYSRPSSWSWTTACRCVNVPRWTSWPVKRMGMPSRSSVPNASASPSAQSTPSPDATASAKPARRPRSRRWSLKPSGTVDSAAPTAASASGDAPVLPKAPWPTSAGVTIFCQFWPQTSRSHVNVSLASNARAKTSSTCATIRATSAAGTTGSVAATVSRYLVSTDGCVRTLAYIIGCVNVGSSISLWPNLR